MPDRLAEGVAAAARLALGRPARLGPVRLVAVDGPSGSGKSTFAAALAERLRAASDLTVELLSTDLLATWDDPFGWWPALEQGVLQPLSRGEPGWLAVNEWSTGAPRPDGCRLVPLPGVLILEGVSAGRQQAADRVSVLVWVETADPGQRLERAVARDGEATRPHLLNWQRREDEHFAADGARARADLLIDTGYAQ